MNKFSKKDSLKNEFIKFSLRTTCQCYPRIFETNNIHLTWTWSIIFCFFSAATAYLIFKGLSDYFEYEIVSKIQVVYERPSLFPVVTLCDSNQFTSKFSEEFLRNVSLNTYGKEVTNMSYEELNSKIDNFIDMARTSANNPSSGTQIKNKLSNPIKIVQCKFDKRMCSESLDFNSVYFMSLGNCLQFNTGKNNKSRRLKSSTSEHRDFGLRLVVEVPLNENSLPIWQSKGLYVFIHNQSLDLTSSNGFSIGLGEETVMAIRRTFSKKVPKPFSSCVDLYSFESELYNIFLKTNKQYTQYECFKMCMQRMVMKKCGCYALRLANLDESTKPCLSMDQLDCIRKQESEFTGKNVTECEQNCPLECESVKYDSQITSFKLDTNYFLINRSKSSESYASLNIFYPYLEYTLIVETPKVSPIDLVANLGGVLGVFLGLSIFNFVELLELACLIIYFFYKK